MRLQEILCSREFQGEIKSAVAVSYGTKCVSDINAVGGGLFEIELCKSINKLLPPGYVCLTKKATLSGDYKFPDNFLDTIESDAFHSHSASDLFLFDEDNSFLDAVSLKTAMSDGALKPFLHNDSKGQVHELVSTEGNEFIGQVFIVTYGKKTNQVETYYFDQSVRALTMPFQEATRNKHGDIIYHGKSFGINRQVLKITSRSADTRKAQSSFNRGVVLDGQFIKEVYVPRGIFENPHTFTLQPREIELQSIRELTLGRR
jgi:hypothetical protein